MSMITNVQLAIVSHLSKAQSLMKEYKHEEANRHIDFVKLIAMRYEHECENLDELWAVIDGGDASAKAETHEAESSSLLNV